MNRYITDLVVLSGLLGFEVQKWIKKTWNHLFGPKPLVLDQAIQKVLAK